MRPIRAALLVCIPVLLLWVVGSATAAAAGRVDVAALQVALRARGLYQGTIDGYRGRRTRAAVRRFQRRAGLAVDGIAGPRTRRALGRRGRPSLGTRAIARGDAGWDVAALQFRLAWRGFPSGPFDGVFGRRAQAATRRYQRWAGLRVDGIAGPATLGSLRRNPIPSSPLRLAWPLRGPVGDRFGPRGNRFHTGIDFPASTGTPVTAAGRGTVTSAAHDPGGYGRLVVIRHRRGVTSWYAHLSAIEVRRGERVGAGSQIGRVGATGSATGPHLHLEVRRRGAAVDPRTALP